MASAPRKGTKPDAQPDWSLSVQQLTAIDLLVTGRNLQDTADTLGVQRSTVSVWTHHHAGFQAALNQKRQELWQDMIDGLRALVPQAVEVLKAELEGEGRLQAATTVLRVAGLYQGVPPPSGPTDPEQIAAQQQLEEHQRQSAAKDAEIAIRRREYDQFVNDMAAGPRLRNGGQG